MKNKQNKKHLNNHLKMKFLSNNQTGQKNKMTDYANQQLYTGLKI